GSGRSLHTVMGATKPYPRQGMLIRKRLPLRPSPKARRRAEMWTVRLAGSTNVLGQTRTMSSFLESGWSGCSRSAISISRARLPMRTGSPFCRMGGSRKDMLGELDLRVASGSLVSGEAAQEPGDHHSTNLTADPARSGNETCLQPNRKVSRL